MDSPSDPESDPNKSQKLITPLQPLQYWHTDAPSTKPAALVLVMTFGIPIGAILVFIPGILFCDKMMEGNITFSQSVLGVVLGIIFLWTSASRVLRIIRRIRLERTFSIPYRGSVIGVLGLGFSIGVSLSCLLLGLLCVGAA